MKIAYFSLGLFLCTAFFLEGCISESPAAAPAAAVSTEPSQTQDGAAQPSDNSPPSTNPEPSSASKSLSGKAIAGIAAIGVTVALGIEEATLGLARRLWRRIRPGTTTTTYTTTTVVVPTGHTTTTISNPLIPNISITLTNTNPIQTNILIPEPKLPDPDLYKGKNFEGNTYYFSTKDLKKTEIGWQSPREIHYQVEENGKFVHKAMSREAYIAYEAPHLGLAKADEANPLFYNGPDNSLWINAGFRFFRVSKKQVNGDGFGFYTLLKKNGTPYNPNRFGLLHNADSWNSPLLEEGTENSTLYSYANPLNGGKKEYYTFYEGNKIHLTSLDNSVTTAENVYSAGVNLMVIFKNNKLHFLQRTNDFIYQDKDNGADLYAWIGKEMVPVKKDEALPGWYQDANNRSVFIIEGLARYGKYEASGQNKGFYSYEQSDERKLARYEDGKFITVERVSKNSNYFKSPTHPDKFYMQYDGEVIRVNQTLKGASPLWMGNTDKKGFIQFITYRDILYPIGKADKHDIHPILTATFPPLRFFKSQSLGQPIIAFEFLRKTNFATNGMVSYLSPETGDYYNEHRQKLGQVTGVKTDDIKQNWSIPDGLGDVFSVYATSANHFLWTNNDKNKWYVSDSYLQHFHPTSQFQHNSKTYYVQHNDKIDEYGTIYCWEEYEENNQPAIDPAHCLPADMPQQVQDLLSK